jgi:hypothetical protein
MVLACLWCLRYEADVDKITGGGVSFFLLFDRKGWTWFVNAYIGVEANEPP